VVKQNAITSRLAIGPGSLGFRQLWRSIWRRRLLRHAGWAALLPICTAGAVSGAKASPALTEDVWLIDSKVAVQLFDCSDLLCGRVIWLLVPRDQGELILDKHNPDAMLRQRRLCGMTILWGLKSTGSDRWGGGWFYNPSDGKTYRFSAKLASADTIVARIYLGIPLFGKTKMLNRVPHGTSAGWC